MRRFGADQVLTRVRGHRDRDRLNRPEEVREGSAQVGQGGVERCTASRRIDVRYADINRRSGLRQVTGHRGCIRYQ